MECWCGILHCEGVAKHLSAAVDSQCGAVQPASQALSDLCGGGLSRRSISPVLAYLCEMRRARALDAARRRGGKDDGGGGGGGKETACAQRRRGVVAIERRESVFNVSATRHAGV